MTIFFGGTETPQKKKEKRKKLHQVKGKDSLLFSKLHQRRREVTMNVFTQLLKYTNTVVVQMKCFEILVYTQVYIDNLTIFCMMEFNYYEGQKLPTSEYNSRSLQSTFKYSTAIQWSRYTGSKKAAFVKSLKHYTINHRYLQGKHSEV